jgi:signal transduction histidine kinase/CheY-like chemotaxis protein/HAMP domain-containing protein
MRAEIGASNVERSGWLARLSLGGSIRAGLIALTLALAAIAALGVADLYRARQRYEDRLAAAYQLESAGSRLLSATVAEQAALSGRSSPPSLRRAAATVDAEAGRVASLAAGDRRSAAIVRRWSAAEGELRRLAAQGRSPGRAIPLRREIANAVRIGRDSTGALAARQAQRRSDARDRATRDSRRALLVAGGAGGLALTAALLLIGALIASIRRPLDDLVGATQRLAAGGLGERVRPGGPEEITDLGAAFNTMAEQLGTARDRIEQEREKLATTIESLGDALVVADTAGVVTAVNPRAEQVVPQLVPGVRADARESPLPPLDEALVDEVIREEGERTLSITAAQLGEDGSQGIVWTVRDISERARLARVKSDFVATASHELRSPLTSIKGFIELLARSGNLSERDREFVDVILRSTDRLVDLVNDLLDVTRLEAGKMEVHSRLFHLGEIVRDVATLMRPRLEDKGQRLDVQVPPLLPRALADPARVRQIVINLLSNAHQYTDEGGRLSISVREDEDMLAMAVSDTGRGMSSEELEHVFDRFVRRDDAMGGTGLGLAIVKSLVELQRGTIEARSEPGSGSTFTVRLPAEPTGDGAVPPRKAIVGKRVLVVDDEPEVASLIAEQLRSFGVEPETAHRGDEAIERLRSDRFDAMTLDMLMPGDSGIDVLRKLRDDPELAHTPVVVVSIVSSGEALLGEWKVAKPVDAEELADVLGSAVMVGRTRVLVVARSSVRPELEPALVRLGLDHEWVTSGAAAAQACGHGRFEVALVDAGIRSPQAVLRALQLRGRRQGRAVVVFSTGDAASGAANLGGDPVPIEEAAGAVLQALGH